MHFGDGGRDPEPMNAGDVYKLEKARNGFSPGASSRNQLC